MLKALVSLIIAEICNGAIPSDKLRIITDGVAPEPATIVVLIEDPDPAGDEFECVHLIDLLPLLLTLAQ